MKNLLKVFLLCLSVLSLASFVSTPAQAKVTTGCYSNLDCDFPQQCEDGVCTGECRSNFDCDFPERCENTVCVGGCRSNLDCDFPDRCVDGVCRR